MAEIKMKGHKDVQYLDVVDLFCQFSDKLELHTWKDENDNEYHVNEPSIEFMKRRMPFLDEEVEELREALEEEDMAEIFDGAIDTAFVALTQAYHVLRTLGFSHIQSVTRTRQGCIQVGITNLMKMPPLEKGVKIQKPDGWEPPQFQEILFPDRSKMKTEENAA